MHVSANTHYMLCLKDIKTKYHAMKIKIFKWVHLKNYIKLLKTCIWHHYIHLTSNITKAKWNFHLMLEQNFLHVKRWSHFMFLVVGLLYYSVGKGVLAHVLWSEYIRYSITIVLSSESVEGRNTTYLHCIRFAYVKATLESCWLESEIIDNDHFLRLNFRNWVTWFFAIIKRRLITDFPHNKI